MKLRMFQVDAFTAERFRGNPAAVIPLQTWLPDELMQRIVQLVAERAPRALAIVALLDQRSRALAAARLACMKPLRTAPFSLTVQHIFSGDTLDLSSRLRLRSEYMEVLGGALVSGALPKLVGLGLSFNKIGGTGMSALANACASGALPALERLSPWEVVSAAAPLVGGGGASAVARCRTARTRPARR